MKSALKKIIFYSALVVYLSSCVTPKDTNLLQDIDIDYGTIPPPDEYRIIPGDVLNIVVYVYDDIETQELFRAFSPQFVASREGNTEYYGSGSGGWGWGGSSSSSSEEGTRSTPPIVVYADGTINFPYLGRIFVQNLTLLEARKLISSRLTEISATATANVTLRNNFFSLIGESGARRVDMKSNNMTIYQALATSGNISDYSERNRVNIIRQTKDGTIVKTFDLRTKDIMNTDYYYIQPNDVIYFPQKNIKFFGGTNSFIGVFGLVTSFIGILVGAFRIF